MKLFKYFILILVGIIILAGLVTRMKIKNGCIHVEADAKYTSHAKGDMLNSIEKVFIKEGKYYLIQKDFYYSYLPKDYERVRELKINAQFYGFPDLHGGNIFTVQNINKDSIEFYFKSPPYNGGSNPFYSVQCNSGKFAINCPEEIEIISSD